MWVWTGGSLNTVTEDDAKMQKTLTDFATPDESNDEHENDVDEIDGLDHDPECAVCDGTRFTTLTTVTGDEREAPCFAGIIYGDAGVVAQ